MDAPGTLAAIMILMRRRRAEHIHTIANAAEAAQRLAEEEKARHRRRRRGSVSGHIIIDRDHAAGHARIMADYFNDNPVYTDYHFRHQ
jgi:hypothetical protein